MLNLYLASIIISIMIITIVSFLKCRTSTTFDFVFIFIIKLYFTLIPIFNLIISFGIMYQFIRQEIYSYRLKKNS